MAPEYDKVDTNMEAPEFVPSTRIPDEIKKMSREASEATRHAPEKVHARHYKIGDFDADTISTETSGFGPGMMTAGEMSSVQARLEGPWKDYSAPQKEKAKREYLELRRSREQRPN